MDWTTEGSTNREAPTRRGIKGWEGGGRLDILDVVYGAVVCGCYTSSEVQYAEEIRRVIALDSKRRAIGAQSNH